LPASEITTVAKSIERSNEIPPLPTGVANTLAEALVLIADTFKHEPETDDNSSV
jgi:hypothetical protein